MSSPQNQQHRHTHDCPGGCGMQVPRHQLSCQPDWYRLPAELRSAINAAYRSRQTDPSPHRRLIREALDWYRDKNGSPLMCRATVHRDAELILAAILDDCAHAIADREGVHREQVTIGPVDLGAATHVEEGK